MEYGEEFERLCSILFQYQYVRNRAELDDVTIRWLYEHSNGNVSTVVSLLHDSQELAIMDGSEVLNVEILNAAYKNRMKMLHSYIVPSKKPQTSRVKKGTPLPLSEQENTAAAVNVSALIQQAKNEGREIAHFLMQHISVEEVSI